MEPNTVSLPNNENNTVKTLFTICIEFVANNLSLVESLEHFPDIIGKKIFQHSLTTDFFASNNSDTQHAIRVFVNAYGKGFMETLCIPRQVALEFGECISILCLPVTRLSLRGCLMGNTDDILKIFADLINLRVLSIAGNGISDDGFRSMLARHKIYKTGFQALEILDVSENTVSLRMLKSLLGLPALKVLVVSIANSLKQSDTNFVTEWDKVVAQKGYQITQATESITSGIQTSGWGAKIIEIWENKVTEWEGERLEKIDKKFQSFYADYVKKVLFQVMLDPNREEYVTSVYLRSKTSSSDGNTVKNNNRCSLSRISSEDRMERNRLECNQSSATRVDMEILRLYMKD